MMMAAISDPSSSTNFLEFVTTHIEADWTIDFDASTIAGHCLLSISRTDACNSEQLRLDCSHLLVRNVALAKTNVPLTFFHDQTLFKFGGTLSINVEQIEDKAFVIRIDYSTTKDSSALQWLKPEQTIGGKYPYMFTQCQSIHARTLLPCQDTPAIKATYSVTVAIKKPLNVVMSANVRTELADRDGGYRVLRFDQTIKIPAYLFALCAGNLTSKSVGPRSAVWCEPEQLDKAAYEFADTESFLSTAEKLTIPYQWGRYDILVLPASFPYGGMENPCLTFLTPSLLAGDRSLVDVVAHEIAHSWTGNLVTNSSWEHFWLNEGFTMFYERKILGRLHGEPFRQFHAILGYNELKEAVEFFGSSNNLTRLVPDLSNDDPDEAFSVVPYEKGHTFLFYLEQLIGGPSLFEPYFCEHIRRFSGKSITSDEWKEFLLKYFSTNPQISSKLDSVDWDSWLKGTGMPPVALEYDQSLAKPCRDLAESWLSSFPSKDKAEKFIKEFIPLQRATFVDQLGSLSSNRVEHNILQSIDQLYQLSDSNNVEVSFRWFRLCLRSNFDPVFEKAARFATLHGRMKYCRPIYRELFNCPSGRQLALDTFEQHKMFYHPIARALIMQDLHLESN